MINLNGINLEINNRVNDKDLVVMCAGCGSVKTGSGWLPYSWSQFLIDIPKAKADMCISHGICKSCAIEIYGSAMAHIFDEA